MLDSSLVLSSEFLVPSCVACLGRLWKVGGRVGGKDLDFTHTVATQPTASICIQFLNTIFARFFTRNHTTDSTAEPPDRTDVGRWLSTLSTQPTTTTTYINIKGAIA